MKRTADLVREVGHGRHAEPGIAAEPTTVSSAAVTAFRGGWRPCPRATILGAMIVVLAGGVGAARFLRGLVRVVPAEEVTVIGNTGDDFIVYGVHVSPDLDIVTYTLGGAIDEERGWGLAGDTHGLLEELRSLGVDAWFTLGDRDYGVCLFRTVAMSAGQTLVGRDGARSRSGSAGIRLLPMTGATVATHVWSRSEDGDRERELHFQEYWVRRGARDDGQGGPARRRRTRAPGPRGARGDRVGRCGADRAVEPGGFDRDDPDGAGDPRRAPGITERPVVGVSPIVGGAPVRGMADKLDAVGRGRGLARWAPPGCTATCSTAG